MTLFSVFSLFLALKGFASEPLPLNSILSPAVSEIGAASKITSVDWSSYFTSPSIFYGVNIADPQTYQKNANEWMAPASTAKLFVAGELLELLGPDFRFRTEMKISWFSSTQASLSLIGEGDPSWGMIEFGPSADKLDTIVETLQNLGIQELGEDIELISRSPELDTISFPLGWKREDFLSCGGTLAQSFNFDINCSTLEILSAKTFRWTSKEIPTPVELQLKSGSSTNVSIELERNPFRYIVKGSWRAGSKKQTFYLPVYDTKTWIRNLLNEKLRSKGISRFRPSHSPNRIESVFLESPPLSEMLKPYLKNSVNFLGDAFLKALGVFSPSFHTLNMLDQGLRALKERLDPLIGSTEFYDGSGLTRIAKIRPEQEFAYLQHLSRSNHFSVFLEALAVAGIDGTLANRMKGTAAQGNLRAKTGTLDGVYNLAGYVPFQNQWVPFVILTRTTVSQSGTARSTQDKVGVRLATVLGNQAQEIPSYPFIERNSGEFWIERQSNFNDAPHTEAVKSIVSR